MKRLMTMVGPRGRAAVLLALVAALSLLVGVAVERVVASPASRDDALTWRAGERSLPRPSRRAAHARPFYLEHLTNELDLSAEQMARIDSILSAQQERFREITHEMAPRFREATEATRRGILDVLDEEQQRDFRELRRGRLPGLRPGISPATHPRGGR